MPASITDKISNTSSGVRPVSTTVTSTRSSGVTTLACADLTGWATDTVVHFVTYQIDGIGEVVAGSQTDWKGIVSGSNINNLTVTGGTDNGNVVGDIVEMLPTASWGKNLAEWALTHGDQDGTLKAGAVDAAAVLADNVVTADKINASAVTTVKVNDAAITPPKWTNTYKFRGTLAATVSSGGTTYTVVPFDTEQFDTGSNFDIVTNKGRFTAPVAGYYQFDATAAFPTAGRISLAFFKNGTVYSYGFEAFVSTGEANIAGTHSDLIQLAQNDYIDLRVVSDVTRTFDTTRCKFSGHLVSIT